MHLATEIQATAELCGGYPEPQVLGALQKGRLTTVTPPAAPARRSPAARPPAAPRPRVLPHLPLERAKRARYSASARVRAGLTRCLTLGGGRATRRAKAEALLETRAALMREAARLNRGSAP